ncbi:hypothetical protein EWM64_g341 [Hericium alpestre]|uniref:Uncharacterized protein n=1 Tax=Hericium alpestre TaxID=135208 RepID=A0A4Z0ABL7_9AGAM|nr:hypothetical protein EWM64_g341 [Hericium alpestre]
MKKLFSAGVDLKWLSALPEASDPARRALAIRNIVREFQDAISAPQRCPQPVIAAVHGLAVGDGWLKTLVNIQPPSATTVHGQHSLR